MTAPRRDPLRTVSLIVTVTPVRATGKWSWSVKLSTGRVGCLRRQFGTAESGWSARQLAFGAAEHMHREFLEQEAHENAANSSS